MRFVWQRRSIRQYKNFEVAISARSKMQLGHRLHKNIDAKYICLAQLICSLTRLVAYLSLEKHKF